MGATQDGEQFFTQMLAAVQWAVYDFARGLTGESEAARDITQDVFVDAWRAIQRRAAPFVGEYRVDEARKWLLHVTYQRVISLRRRQRLITWEPLGNEEHEPGPLREPMALEDQVAEAEVLRAALLSLGPDDAACLLLNVVHGYTATEIAAIVEISPDAAKKRLSRAKSRLRVAYLAQDGQRSQPHTQTNAQRQERKLL